MAPCACLLHSHVYSAPLITDKKLIQESYTIKHKENHHSYLFFLTTAVVVQSLSHVWLFATPWTAGHQASLSVVTSQSLLKLMLTESVMPSNHLILCHPLLLPPSVFPSTRRISNESALHIRWPKYWSFSFSISPSNEYLRLISFRIDWFDLLAAQGTLKSLLHHRSWKASILWCSAFFMVQLSHSYVIEDGPLEVPGWNKRRNWNTPAQFSLPFH